MSDRKSTGCMCVLLAFCFMAMSSCGGLAELGPDASDLFDDPDVAALANAAARGDLAAVDQAVAQGVDVNAVGKEDMTPLLWSMAYNKEGFRRLLEKGADPNHQTNRQYSIMNLTARHEDPYYLKTLLAHGGDVNLVNPKTGATPIFEAIGSCNNNNVKILIEAGADLNFQKRIAGTTPMLYAAMLNQFEIVYTLLRVDADYGVQDSTGYTIAHKTLDKEGTLDPESDGERWRKDVVALLESKGVDFEAVRTSIPEIRASQREKLEEISKRFAPARSVKDGPADTADTVSQGQFRQTLRELEESKKASDTRRSQAR